MWLIEYIARHGNYTIVPVYVYSSVAASNVGAWFLDVTSELSYCIMTRTSLTHVQIRELFEVDNSSYENEAPEHEGMEDLLGDDVEISSNLRMK